MIKESDKKRDEKDRINIPIHKWAENPKVTVIVPVYKVDKYLTQCLNSIVNQTMEELEIIIVDEGEQDRCREIIDYFEARDPRIVAPHQKNGGYGASCNLGINIARGEYISIIESDDYIDPDMYEVMYEYALALDADVVKSPYREFFQNGIIRDCPYRLFLSSCLPERKTFSMKEYGEMLEVHASLWSGIYRRSYLQDKKIHFVEAKGAAYVDVGFRIDTLINTDKVAWLDQPFYNYRVDSVGSSTNTFKLAPMIKRWSEQHNKFAGIKEDYTKYYGPHIILDEYLNTVGWLNLIDATPEEYDSIRQNLIGVDLKMIEESQALTDAQKSDLLLFIKEPEKFKKRAGIKRTLRKGVAHTTRFLDRLANTTLLIWFFVMTFASVLAQVMIAMNLNLETKSANILFGICGVVGCMAFIGCLLCCLGKILRKLSFKLLALYEKKRKEGMV